MCAGKHPEQGLIFPDNSIGDFRLSTYSANSTGRTVGGDSYLGSRLSVREDQNGEKPRPFLRAVAGHPQLGQAEARVALRASLEGVVSRVFRTFDHPEAQEGCWVEFVCRRPPWGPAAKMLKKWRKYTLGLSFFLVLRCLRDHRRFQFGQRFFHVSPDMKRILIMRERY